MVLPQLFLMKIGFLGSEGVLLGPECRTESLRTESISSSPSPVLSSTPMTAGHSKTSSRDSCMQTDKGQDTSKTSTAASQSMTLPALLSRTSPVYIPDRLAGQLTLSARHVCLSWRMVEITAQLTVPLTLFRGVREQPAVRPDHEKSAENAQLCCFIND